MKKALIVLSFVVIALPVLGQQQMFNSCVENEGADISVTLPGSFTTANAYLPNPFTMSGGLGGSGTTMTTKEQWKQRRQETLKLLERTVYGTKPAKPTTVTGTVSNSSISVSVSEGGRNATFTATVTIPTGTKPANGWPAVIRVGNSGAAASNLGTGIASINFNQTAVGSEQGSRTNKTGAFYTVYGNTSKTGLLGAWAWGVSRIIDVIENDANKLIDPTALAVTGCSRLGKAAFAIGVFDQRIALTIPMESGSGGTNIMRGAAKDATGGTSGAQSPSSAYDETYWLGDDFNSFRNNVNNLPIDIHQAVALVAPRGFFVMDKTASSAGNWLNIPSSWASALAGVKVYEALGVPGNFHYMNSPTQAHCSGADSYNTQLRDFADKFLKRTKAPGTSATFTTGGTAPNMTTWINWTTPSLSGSLNIGGCGDGGGGDVCEGFSLEVTAASGGKVTRSTDISCNVPNSKVTLTATANPNWIFDGWSGDASGTTSPLEVTMDKDKIITAKFKVNGTYDYTSALCGGKAFEEVKDNVSAMPNSGECVYIKDYVQIEADLLATGGSNVTINGTSFPCAGANVQADWDKCPATATNKPVKIDGGYYVYVEKGLINTYTPSGATDPNGWKGVVAGAIEIRDATSVNPSVSLPGASVKLSVKTLSNSAVNVNFRAMNSGEAVLKLYNLKGNVITSSKVQTTAGRDYSHTLGARKLPNGFYIVKLYDGGNVTQARVMVSK